MVCVFVCFVWVLAVGFVLGFFSPSFTSSLLSSIKSPDKWTVDMTTLLLFVGSTVKSWGASYPSCLSTDMGGSSIQPRLHLQVICCKRNG